MKPQYTVYNIHQSKYELFHVEMKFSRQVSSGPLDRNHTTYNFEINKISHSDAVQKFWYWHLTCPSDQVYWINRHRQMILKKYPILHTQVSNLGQKYLKIHFWPKYFILEFNILNQNRTADFFVRLKIPCHFGDPWHSGPTISWTFLTQILVWSISGTFALWPKSCPFLGRRTEHGSPFHLEAPQGSPGEEGYRM